MYKTVEAKSLFSNSIMISFSLFSFQFLATLQSRSVFSFTDVASFTTSLPLVSSPSRSLLSDNTYILSANINDKIKKSKSPAFIFTILSHLSIPSMFCIHHIEDLSCNSHILYRHLQESFFVLSIGLNCQ